MGVSYNRLWKMLIDKNMKRIEMQYLTGISGNILARMGKNQYVSMETIEKICKKLDGEQEADFISCVTFGKSAEFAQKYLHKGMRIVIGGRISTGNYKDKDGKTIYTTDVIVEEHEFAQNKDNGVGADSSETPKTDKDGFMEAPEGEVPFD